MSSGEAISVKQVQLVLIRYGLSTYDNGAVITHNSLPVFGLAQHAGETGTV